MKDLESLCDYRRSRSRQNFLKIVPVILTLPRDDRLWSNRDNFDMRKFRQERSQAWVHGTSDAWSAIMYR